MSISHKFQLHSISNSIGPFDSSEHNRLECDQNIFLLIYDRQPTIRTYYGVSKILKGRAEKSLSSPT